MGRGGHSENEGDEVPRLRNGCSETSPERNSFPQTEIKVSGSGGLPRKRGLNYEEDGKHPGDKRLSLRSYRRLPRLQGVGGKQPRWRGTVN